MLHQSIKVIPPSPIFFFWTATCPVLSLVSGCWSVSQQSLVQKQDDQRTWGFLHSPFSHCHSQSARIYETNKWRLHFVASWTDVLVLFLLFLVWSLSFCVFNKNFLLQRKGCWDVRRIQTRAWPSLSLKRQEKEHQWPGSGGATNSSKKLLWTQVPPGFSCPENQGASSCVHLGINLVLMPTISKPFCFSKCVFLWWTGPVGSVEGLKTSCGKLLTNRDVQANIWKHLRSPVNDSV